MGERDWHTGNSDLRAKFAEILVQHSSSAVPATVAWGCPRSVGGSKNEFHVKVVTGGKPAFVQLKWKLCSRALSRVTKFADTGSEPCMPELCMWELVFLGQSAAVRVRGSPVAGRRFAAARTVEVDAAAKVSTAVPSV